MEILPLKNSDCDIASQLTVFLPKKCWVQKIFTGPADKLRSPWCTLDYGGVLGVDNTKSALAQVTPSNGFFKKLGPQMSLASNTLAY